MLRKKRALPGCLVAFPSDVDVNDTLIGLLPRETLLYQFDRFNNIIVRRQLSQRRSHSRRRADFVLSLFAASISRSLSQHPAVRNLCTHAFFLRAGHREWLKLRKKITCQCPNGARGRGEERRPRFSVSLPIHAAHTHRNQTGGQNPYTAISSPVFKRSRGPHRRRRRRRRR